MLKGDTTFSRTAFEEFTAWAERDRKITGRIKALIADIHRNGPDKGIGKPEQLRYLPGCCSRRITEEHRLAYTVRDDVLYILSYEGHYRS